MVIGSANSRHSCEAGVHRMARGINAYIRAYQHVVSNFHPGAIQNDQIEIGVNAVPQADVGTVVAPERGLQIAPLPNASQKLAGRFPAQFIILRVRTVITAVACGP